MRFCLLSSLLFLLSSCAHSPRHFAAKPEKIRAWSNSLGQESATPPYLRHFQQGTKHLFYLATLHSNQAPNPTFQLIHSVLSQNPIQIAVLEGFPHAYGVNPKRMIEYSQKDGRDGLFKGAEASFAIQELQAKHLAFTGGEPDETLILKSVQEMGYKLKDLLCFYFIRQLPQYQRDGTLNRISIPQAYSLFFQRFNLAQLGITQQDLPSYAEFQFWYQEKMGKPFLPSQITNETAAPYENGKLFTQRISAVVGRVRDIHIVQVIAEALNQFDQVLVIYGAGHFPTQSQAIEAMMN